MRLPKLDVEGHIHFVTTNTWHRQPLFASRALAQIIVNNLRFYSQHLDYELFGYVVMPDHLHALILPHRRTPISKVMQSVKKYAAREIIDCLLEGTDLQMIPCPPALEHVREGRARCLQQEFPKLADFFVRRPKKETHQYQIWQDGFYDFNVFTEHKFNEKLNYIHNNPVEWGLAETPMDYPFSSYRRWNDE